MFFEEIQCLSEVVGQRLAGDQPTEIKVSVWLHAGSLSLRLDGPPIHCEGGIDLPKAFLSPTEPPLMKGKRQVIWMLGYCLLEELQRDRQKGRILCLKERACLDSEIPASVASTPEPLEKVVADCRGPGCVAIPVAPRHHITLAG
jgi:hypothetical protein